MANWRHERVVTRPNAFARVDERGESAQHLAETAVKSQRLPWNGGAPVDPPRAQASAAVEPVTATNKEGAGGIFEKASIDDLYKTSEFLFEEISRLEIGGEHAAVRRVAGWIRFVAEQREEYEARKRTEKTRYPSLGSSMRAIWRVRGDQVA